MLYPLYENTSALLRTFAQTALFHTFVHAARVQQDARPKVVY